MRALERQETQTNTPGGPTWLTVAQAAGSLGVDRQTVYDACAVGGLRHVRLMGRRCIRIHPTALVEWMQAQEIVNAA